MTKSETPDQTRRTIVKTVAYVAPMILTLKATPALAHHGSQELEAGDADVHSLVDDGSAGHPRFGPA